MQAVQTDYSQARQKGTISKLNQGFGFIEGPDGKDYFFHWSFLTKFSKQFRNLQVGDEVEFFPSKTEKGPRALEVETL